MSVAAYLFLLLSDRCFQLLNFANFAIECGGELDSRAGRATTLRERYEAYVRYHFFGSGRNPSQGGRRQGSK